MGTVGLALLAALCFFLKLIGVNLGNVDLVVLGLLFLSLAVAVLWWPGRPIVRRIRS